MKILYLSAECYPIAKVGGLADVTGALPKYLNQEKNINVSVVIPKYNLPWFEDKSFETIYSNHISLDTKNVKFKVYYYSKNGLGFEIYFIDIPKFFNRNGIYSDENGVFFEDETERYVCFQRAFLQWINNSKQKPDIIHCHDHHTGLIPFMMQYSEEFDNLKNTPTVFSIHNQRYQGAFNWNKVNLLPKYDLYKWGFLDWGNSINPLASAIKCAWTINTVSPSYMNELKENSCGLEWLFDNEKHKSIGILNGIDTDVWNPKTDPLLNFRMVNSLSYFKSKNKNYLNTTYNLESNKPIISFIGRFAFEKGADVLAHTIEQFLEHTNDAVFIILGTGDKNVEQHYQQLEKKYPKQVKSLITYSEKVSHCIYAGSDFIIMPSRVEPCGLNQMYAMQYGSIPIVRNIGGLKDSVTGIDQPNGTGIKFEESDIKHITDAIKQSIKLYNNQKLFKTTRENCYNQNNSWHRSAKQYLKIYYDLTQRNKQ